jgi:hypothetical protein
MDIVSYKIPNSLAEKDEQFLNIEQIIEAKRRMLLEKQKKFKLIQKQNQFLDIIKDDYSKYYSYISKQKQDQIKALEILNSYIGDLTISGKLTKNNINDAGFEQKKIIKEIKSIRKGLDGIIDSTNYLNSQLN